MLRLAGRLLRPGGVAYIHIRHNDGSPKLKPRRWGYKQSPFFMITYALDEFQNRPIECGFEPVDIVLKPVQPSVNEYNYAYFFLRKPDSAQSS